uniref:Uncharacterized protein n=1 Tax=Glossina austeni TaxID=7395 RepID=A0A1A9UZI1_GLOAU
MKIVFSLPSVSDSRLILLSLAASGSSSSVIPPIFLLGSSSSVMPLKVKFLNFKTNRSSPKLSMSTRNIQTRSSDITHNDSKSIARESLNVLSSVRLICTVNSQLRPASKCGAAIGPNSTLICKMPSFGRVAFGSPSSLDT